MVSIHFIPWLQKLNDAKHTHQILIQCNMHQPCRSCMTPLISSGVTARTPLVRKMSVPRSRRSLAIQLFSFSWSHSPAHSIPTWQMWISHMWLWIMNYFAKLHLTHCINPRPIINPLLRLYIRLYKTTYPNKSSSNSRRKAELTDWSCWWSWSLLKNSASLSRTRSKEKPLMPQRFKAWEVATWILPVNGFSKLQNDKRVFLNSGDKVPIISCTCTFEFLGLSRSKASVEFTAVCTPFLTLILLLLSSIIFKIARLQLLISESKHQTATIQPAANMALSVDHGCNTIDLSNLSEWALKARPLWPVNRILQSHKWHQTIHNARLFVEKMPPSIFKR